MWARVCSLGYVRTNGDATKCNVQQLIAAVVCAGLYPRIVRVQKPKAEFQETMAGAFEKRNQSGTVKFFVRVRATSIEAFSPVLCCWLVAIVCATDRQACFVLTYEHSRGCSWDRCMLFLQEDPGRVFLHPGSVYSDEREHAHLYLVYFEKALTTQLYIRDATFANPYSILVCLCANVRARCATSLELCSLSVRSCGRSYLVETSPCNMRKEQSRSTTGLSTVPQQELLCLRNRFVWSWTTYCKGRSRGPRPTSRNQPSSEQSCNC